ncbi:hypothetical protein Nepgr_008201 [Nepenthes gracilis]|uniref:Formin-like protein n=1 Tax=Nepenthes gracilis TaxID=150966 RepID=A0AAD3XJ80_NEPGR|nr:hypothetical protein Nepgr_008201 [Nepenthes gracilis]
MKSYTLRSLMLAISVALSVTVDGETSRVHNSEPQVAGNARRILHQSFFPASSIPPPGSLPSPPPPNVSDEPFFPEDPNGPTTSYQSPPPPPAPPANSTIPIQTATQPTRPTKKMTIAISVGIVTLGMLSALAFYLYRHRVKLPGENQKLVGSNDSQRNVFDESRVPPSSFLYIGTVELPNQRSATVNEENLANRSPHYELNSAKRSDRYRPSPELQPLPPLNRVAAAIRNSPQRHSPTVTTALSNSSDEDNHEANFYTPQGSVAGYDEGCSTPVPRPRYGTNGSPMNSTTDESHGGCFVPYSRRKSPRPRISASALDVVKHAIIPSIRASPPQTPPPPPPPKNQSQQLHETNTNLPSRAKFSANPSPPSFALLPSIINPSQRTQKLSAPPPRPPPPPPPQPPPPPPLAAPRKISTVKASASTVPAEELSKPQMRSTESRVDSTAEASKCVEELDNGCSSSARINDDSAEGTRPKLKPLHWDKVRATSARATVWDRLESSSFQLNEDAMESLFGCNSANSVHKETTKKSVLPPPVEKENRVLDPKKSQNIAILLRALNVTRDEVSEALLDGNPEGLGTELLETLVKMAPTKEEEIKLKGYNGDISKLDSAERFLKTILDIPFAFRRAEAMLYRANFDAEVDYLRKSFETLEKASEELKNSRLFLRLLEAVLRTGNRMNVGTNRGDAKAFKLETLLKLVDIKGTDGKTTLLHFVVQEIIRSEGIGLDPATEISQNKMTFEGKEDEFRRQGLKVVSGLSRELYHVKNAAGMDSDVLGSYVSKLEDGLKKIGSVSQYEKPDMQGRFFESMKAFLKGAEEEIALIKGEERKALALVKEVTEYFHGDTAKEEAHPFRIFMIVRDFLSILDHVCKDVGRIQERTVMGSARSFRISANAPPPVLKRYNIRQDESSGEEIPSP